ncbi:hypothetical protein [Streptomyces zhihengii]
MATPTNLTADVDMDTVAVELHEALARIDGLRHQHPYDASGYGSEPVWTDIGPGLHTPIPTPGTGHGTCITKTNPNPNTKTNPAGIPARTPEMAA